MKNLMKLNIPQNQALRNKKILFSMITILILLAMVSVVSADPKCAQVRCSCDDPDYAICTDAALALDCLPCDPNLNYVDLGGVKTEAAASGFHSTLYGTYFETEKEENHNFYFGLFDPNPIQNFLVFANTMSLTGQSGDVGSLTVQNGDFEISSSTNKIVMAGDDGSADFTVRNTGDFEIASANNKNLILQPSSGNVQLNGWKFAADDPTASSGYSYLRIEREQNPDSFFGITSEGDFGNFGGAVLLGSGGSISDQPGAIVYDNQSEGAFYGRTENGWEKLNIGPTPIQNVETYWHPCSGGICYLNGNASLDAAAGGLRIFDSTKTYYTEVKDHQLKLNGDVATSFDAYPVGNANYESIRDDNADYIRTSSTFATGTYDVQNLPDEVRGHSAPSYVTKVRLEAKCHTTSYDGTLQKAELTLRSDVLTGSYKSGNGIKKNISTNDGYVLFGETFDGLWTVGQIDNMAVSLDAELFGAVEKSGEGFLNSFAAGTKVLMADGSYKNIELVSEGDSVMSYDLDKKEFVTANVVHTTNGQKKHMVVNGILDLSQDHKVYVADKGFIQAINLKKGDKLLSSDGTYTLVDSLEIFDETIPVYDISLDKYNVFFADNVLVHNELAKGQALECTYVGVKADYKYSTDDIYEVAKFGKYGLALGPKGIASSNTVLSLNPDSADQGWGVNEPLNFYVGGSQWISSNAYFDGQWKRSSNGYASAISFDNGAINLKTGGTGNTGETITWNDALTIDKNGVVDFDGSDTSNFVLKNSALGVQTIKGQVIFEAAEPLNPSDMYSDAIKVVDSNGDRAYFDGQHWLYPNREISCNLGYTSAGATSVSAKVANGEIFVKLDSDVGTSGWKNAEANGTMGSLNYDVFWGYPKSGLTGEPVTARKTLRVFLDDPFDSSANYDGVCNFY